MADHRSISLKPVQSTNVDSHGYDAGSQTLAVKFKSGGVYHYEGVPPEVAAKLGSAKSIGAFIATEIKPKFKAKRQP